jgi:hypothetical protein
VTLEFWRNFPPKKSKSSQTCTRKQHFPKKIPNFWVKKTTRFVKEKNWSLSTSNGGKIANTYHTLYNPTVERTDLTQTISNGRRELSFLHLESGFFSFPFLMGNFGELRFCGEIWRKLSVFWVLVDKFRKKLIN